MAEMTSEKAAHTTLRIAAPNSNTISTQVANGQSIFDRYLKVYDKAGTTFTYSYKLLHQILICLPLQFPLVFLTLIR